MTVAGSRTPFFIRCKEEEPNNNECESKCIELHEHEHVPFFTRNGMSYSERIWCALKTIQDLCKKMFCRMAAGQSLNDKITLTNATAEFWSYFTYNLSGVTVNTKVSEGSNRVCWANLSVETKSIKRVRHCIRIITNNHLTELRSVLGSRFGVGIKKRFPPKGGCVQHCLHGDDVNIIIIDESRIQTGSRIGRHYLLRINERGFDFNFEPTVYSLVIECRFNRIRASDNLVRELVSYQAIRHVYQSELVPIGITFFYNGSLVKVVEINNQTCICTDMQSGTNLRIHLSLEVVMELLRQQST